MITTTSFHQHSMLISLILSTVSFLSGQITLSQRYQRATVPKAISWHMEQGHGYSQVRAVRKAYAKDQRQGPELFYYYLARLMTRSPINRGSLVTPYSELRTLDRSLEKNWLIEDINKWEERERETLTSMQQISLIGQSLLNSQ